MRVKAAGQIASVIPGIIGDFFRQYLYKLLSKEVSKNIRIKFGSYVVYEDLQVGDNVIIEENCVISRCNIGDDAIIAENVSIMSGTHHHGVGDLITKIIDQPGKEVTVNIGSNGWIDTHLVILNDVKSGVVVGAGSVVTNIYDENSIIGGVAARLIHICGK